MRLDLFVKLKYQSNAIILSVATSITMPDLQSSDKRHICRAGQITGSHEI